jgi:hypothetical protein
MRSSQEKTTEHESQARIGTDCLLSKRPSKYIALSAAHNLKGSTFFATHYPDTHRYW